MEGGISSHRVAKSLLRGWHLSRDLKTVKKGDIPGRVYDSGNQDLGPEVGRHCVCGTLSSIYISTLQLIIMGANPPR